MQPPPRLDLGNPQQPQQQQSVPPHFPPPPYREETSAPKQRSGFSRILPTFVTLSAFGGLVVLAWFAYQEGKGPVSDDEIPVIKAEKEPFKHVPEGSAENETPNIDKEVYNSFTNDKPKVEAQKVEVIPDEERPIDRSFLKQFAGTGEDEGGNTVKQEAIAFGDKKSAGKPAVENVTLEAKPLPLAKPNETLPTPNTGGIEVIRKIQTARQDPTFAQPSFMEEKSAEEENEAEKILQEEVPAAPDLNKKEVVKKSAVAKAKPAQKTPAKKEATKIVSGVRIQLGAFRSDTEATREWKKIQGKHKSLFSGLTMMIQKAEIPGKGTMFRLQAGPVKSKDAARTLCKQLVAAGQGCFVAK